MLIIQLGCCEMLVGTGRDSRGLFVMLGVNCKAGVWREGKVQVDKFRRKGKIRGIRDLGRRLRDGEAGTGYRVELCRERDEGEWGGGF